MFVSFGEFSGHTIGVWFALSVVVFVFLCAMGVIGLSAYKRRPQQGFVEAYLDSVKAIRHHDDEAEHIAVEHQDVAVADVFSAFPQYEGDAYMSPRELNDAVSEITSATGVDKVKKVADQFKKEDHVA
ncbi:hypothetical protein JTE88_02770 [Arcanobacterium phocisimile]|uniref:Uncharacterized protein n=1 Tax=Arcanobacterium phocisimile TaxID=1302235 RepID=A0ABX7IHR8_9ACTO|nr:hypothetical protein [Arcanobacterium phocisimile]QRV02676.1 hypothetical protein JTE88_02770 [Arcanobacterium phocisimile]